MNDSDKIYALLVNRVAFLFGVSLESLNENTRFVEDLNAKSVNYSQLTTYLEAELDVEIPFMKFRRNKTLGEAVDFVVELLEQ